MPQDFNKCTAGNFEAVEVTEQLLFPTQIFSIVLGQNLALSLNEHLKVAIYENREKDQSGISRSNYRSLGGWHSKNDLHKDHAYTSIVGLIAKASAHISAENKYSQTHELKIGTMWSIINPPGSFNRAHVHPDCMWSGVYYVQTPDDCGNIEFIDPRVQNTMQSPNFQAGEKRPKKVWNKMNVTPRAGRMILFPSWLYHAVAPNLSKLEGADADRIIISFNLNQVKKTVLS